MLNHGGFNLAISSGIDTVLVNVQLIIDLDDMGVVLQEDSELIKQERATVVENGFLERIIPQDSFNLAV